MYCNCKDWRENIDKVNSPAVLSVARTGEGHYDGKVFTHCPWCGKELKNVLVEIPREDLVNIWGSPLIGEGTRIAAFVEIGNDVVIGKNCRIQAHVFIPPGTRIGDNVFIGPGTIFCNDKKPPSHGEHWDPVTVEDNASIGAGCLLLPGAIIPEGSKVPGGTVVRPGKWKKTYIWKMTNVYE